MPPLHPGDTFPQLTLNIPGVQAIRVSGLVGIRVAALWVDDEQEVGSVYEAMQAGLPAGLADAFDDACWDGEFRAETDEALALISKDVGTPIIRFGPPRGPASFGPVISRLPTGWWQP
jgi:hypothetical protein